MSEIQCPIGCAHPGHWCADSKECPYAPKFQERADPRSEARKALHDAEQEVLAAVREWLLSGADVYGANGLVESALAWQAAEQRLKEVGE